MLRYTCSILSLLTSSFLMAQPDLEQPRDSASGKSGLRIGIDLARYVERVINPEIRGIEVLSQYEVSNNWYLTAEGGYEVAEPEFENYNYSLNGGFLKLGIDYDFLDNPYDYDIFYLGLHYGLSLYQQQATDIPIESYWGNSIQNLEKESLSAQWIEVVMGLNAELYFARNFFIGWTVRGRFLTVGNDFSKVNPYLIPGYGKQPEDFALGLTWALMYRIPLQ